jgi:serine/threonine protein kinase
MSETIKLTVCPKCQAPIPADAPQGLCPRCVLGGAADTSDGGTTVAGDESPSISRVAAAFPQLEILELIGRGGMGFVFKARQPNLDRFVALKLLPDKLAQDPHFAERFNREGRFLAKLSHPNIVSVFDFGQAGGFYFLTMEYVDGVNLRQAMRAGRFSPTEALAIVPKICEALQYAHEQGVLHRDIKPENILLDARGRVKIADFGIAKLVGEEAPAFTLTGTGHALGTPHYMAPEQLEKPGEVDHRADIYSLGVVFYEMLTGELPIGRFKPPSERTPLDQRVDEIVMRALERERELRQRNAGEFKTQVEQVTSTPQLQRAAPPRPAPTPKPSRTILRTAVTACLVLFSFLAVFSLVVAVIVLAYGRLMRPSAKPATVMAPTAVAEPALHVTFTSVDLREEDGKEWLALDYAQNVQGPCELVVRTDGQGRNHTTRKSAFAKNVPGGGSVLHQRIQWLLPDDLDKAARSELRATLLRQRLYKTLSLQPGAEQLLFEVPLPNGGVLSASFGAALEKEPATPDSDPHAAQIRLATEALKEARQRFDSGLISRQELAHAERDLALAKARGDARSMASAELKLAQTILEIVRQQFDAGVLSASELREAEMKVATAEANVKAALK